MGTWLGQYSGINTEYKVDKWVLIAKGHIGGFQMENYYENIRSEEDSG
jgi:hypothetical protein